jgi:hypothetical protein
VRRREEGSVQGLKERRIRDTFDWPELRLAKEEKKERGFDLKGGRN